MDTASDAIYAFSHSAAVSLLIILLSSLLLDCLDTFVLHENLMTLNGDFNEVVPSKKKKIIRHFYGASNSASEPHPWEV